ncbi:hypothetical protein B0H14DRAFT_3712243, partial [Mycena olivaceomarginata]
MRGVNKNDVKDKPLHPPSRSSRADDLVLLHPAVVVRGVISGSRGGRRTSGGVGCGGGGGNGSGLANLESFERLGGGGASEVGLLALQREGKLPGLGVDTGREGVRLVPRLALALLAVLALLVPGHVPHVFLVLQAISVTFKLEGYRYFPRHQNPFRGLRVLHAILLGVRDVATFVEYEYAVLEVHPGKPAGVVLIHLPRKLLVERRDGDGGDAICGERDAVVDVKANRAGIEDDRGRAVRASDAEIALVDALEHGMAIVVVDH